VKHTETVTIHICDGCQAHYIQLANDELPVGFFVTVYERHSGGAEAGELYVCRESCLLKAFRRRADVWNPPHEETQ
jgi:hypothetical protein